MFINPKYRPVIGSPTFILLMKYDLLNAATRATIKFIPRKKIDINIIVLMIDSNNFVPEIWSYFISTFVNIYKSNLNKRK